MQSVFEAAGGSEGLRRLAHAWHERVMADEVVSHAFSHGFKPDHVERLAAYWAEALGGSTAYSDAYGDESSVVKIHSGNGEHEEMNQRAIACFDLALRTPDSREMMLCGRRCTTTSRGQQRRPCTAITAPSMMCRTVSASRTGHGTAFRNDLPAACSFAATLPNRLLSKYTG